MHYNIIKKVNTGERGIFAHFSVKEIVSVRSWIPICRWGSTIDYESIRETTLHTLAPGLKKVKEYGNILSEGMRHLSQRIQSWLKGWITPPSDRVVALK